MNKATAFLMAILCCAFFLKAQENPALEKEQAAVMAVALDYIESWYEGNPERMARALHPALHKVGLRSLAPEGKLVLSPIGYTAMVELVTMGVGKRVPLEMPRLEVRILDISRTIASIKTVAPDFTDYLLLAKMEGQWKIVSVLWEPAK